MSARAWAWAWAWAGASVTLVSAAQLAMHWGMTRLPRIESLPATSIGQISLPALAAVLLGILGYGASLLCWLGALAGLPLNRAYSLLSLSYPIVYLCGAWLPGMEGSLSAGKTAGVLLVMTGVVLINARRGPAR